MLEVDEVLFKRRQSQIKELQNISKNAPDDECRITAIKQLITDIEAENRPSRLLDVLRNKIDEIQSLSRTKAMAP